ncbi:MAG: hypothetical protein HYW86_05330 [Candidatus Roizmanbacteria bacterium]|nr:MAG: hypothetical protein HYW86_05330 [Candidatus Roizmanbacteria bacterium]
MAEDSSFTEGAKPLQPFDKSSFFQAIRLKDSFFDYGLNEDQKAKVVEELDKRNDILLQGIEQTVHRRSALDMLSELFVPNDNIPALNGYGYGFVERNLRRFETIVTSSLDYAHKKEVLNLVLRLSNSKNKDQQHSLVGSLQRILEQEVLSPPSKDERLGKEDSYKTYLQSFQKIFQQGNDEQVIKTTQFLAEAFDAASTPEQKRHIGNLVANTIWSNNERDPYDLRTQASRELVAYVLKDFGLNIAKLAKVWGNYSLKTGLIGMASLNLDSIFDLEAARPNIARTLCDEFNINLFHRYPTEVLIAQYDQRTDMRIPYGVMINSIADHNEAFSNLGMIGLMKSIHYELQKLGYGIRVYEGGSEEEVKKYFDQSNQRYGAKTPEFGFILGHGHSDSIQMDWESSKQPSRIIRQQSFQGKPSLRFTDYMKDGATLVLISCSTGVKGGIAQEISKQGITVVGPDQKAGVNNVSISKDANGFFDIQVFYCGAKSNKYKNGAFISPA